MRRSYDSSRRLEAAERTRRDIVQAAIKLHWDGITDFAALAEEAGCSVSTVRKHFPTKEHVFRDCTRAFAETLELPDPEAIARIEVRAARVEHAIRELLRVHESMFGYAWYSALTRADSPALDAVMTSYEQLADAISEIVAPAGSERAGLVRGLLDFLTYRALRTSGGLTPDAAFEQTHEAVRHAIRIDSQNDTRSTT